MAYFVYVEPHQRSMAEKDYQEALRTPGIYLIRSWHGLLCAKYSGTLPPRMTKESIPLYTAGGRAAQVRRRCR